MEANDQAEESGGSGGECATARDTRMVERAVRQRWPIPDELRPRLVEELGKVVKSPKASHRNKVAAARVLLAADALNLQAEKGADTMLPPPPVPVNVNVTVNHELTLAGRIEHYATFFDRLAVQPRSLPGTAAGHDPGESVDT